MRNLSGPFDIFDWTRRTLLSNKIFGVFFYKLLSCPWCIGFHCGYSIYIISVWHISVIMCFLWGLVGSFVVFAFDQIFDLIFALKEKLSK